MIITGGFQKGRKIKTVKSRDVRPTSSKVRESIFNMLQSSIENTVMLDLFAGSGIMGLEALSRGAKKVVFIEKSFNVAKILKENLAGYNFVDEIPTIDYEIFITDAVKFLDKSNNIKFDIIFIDPPYASGLIAPSLTKIKEKNILQPDGLIIIEHSPDYKVSDIANSLGFSILKEKKYGDTCITIIKNTEI
jgi:16S rRNA (guanine966-N2)-methyltransferase